MQSQAGLQDWNDHRSVDRPPSFALPRCCRKAETEADVIGVQVMARACYDPAAMISMFQKLGAAEAREGGSAMPKFLRTHPHSSDRWVAGGGWWLQLLYRWTPGCAVLQPPPCPPAHPERAPCNRARCCCC